MRVGQLLASFLTMAMAPTHASSQTVALNGRVTSLAEGAMEGVLVTANEAGSPISITVVSDENGRYAFPANRLAPGDYALAIRAEGYELAAPASAHVEKGATANRDVALATKTDITAQMTNSEWFASMPGADADKRPLIECMSCHTLERVVKSTYSSDDFIAVLGRMANYANNSTQARIQFRHEKRDIPAAKLRKVADYLASVNRSHGPWAWPLRQLPRPKGRATQVIITEYALPRPTIAPHDVRVDADGYVWYSNFAEPFLGRLDPRNGAHREYAYPLLKPDFPVGSLDLEPDADGNLWLALMFQAGVARFDKKTETFSMFPVDPALNDDASQQSMVMPSHSSVDNRVWTNDVARQSIMRLDPESGGYKRIDPFGNAPKGPSHAPYGMFSDAGNNLWFMDFGDENVGRIDAKTLAPTLYPTPTRGSRPRRGMFDGQRLWFAEFAANKLAVFDTQRESFREWPAPTPHSYPYDAFVDRSGDLWSGNMANDRVLRMRPDTGESVEYLLPHPTNIRRVFVDNSAPRPTFWAGSNHGAAIIKLEPLD